MYRNIRAIAFDLDGTLIPTMNEFADIASRAMAKIHGVDPVWARQEYLNTSGIPFFQQLEKIFPGDSRNSEAIELFESEKEELSERVVLDQSILDSLKELRKQGLKIAVSSNNFENLVFKSLGSEGMAAFDLVCGFKPNFAKGKAHMQKIFAELNVKPQEVLFVGDSLSDMKMASECGLHFIGVLGTFKSEDFRAINHKVNLVHSVTELKNLLEFS